MLEKLLEVLTALVTAINANTAALKDDGGETKPKRQRGRTAAGEDPVTGAALPAAQTQQPQPTQPVQPASTTVAAQATVQSAQPAAAQNPTTVLTSSSPQAGQLAYQTVAAAAVAVADRAGDGNVARAVFQKYKPGAMKLDQVDAVHWPAIYTEYQAMLAQPAVQAAPAASNLV